MRFPVKNFKKNWYDAQPFGSKTSYGYHEAADINRITGGDTDFGQPIFAIADGIVTSVHEHTTGFGKHLHIKHDGPWGTVWSHMAHCDKILVDVGQTVTEGLQVATAGKTGTSIAHLHFALKLQPTGTDAIAKTLEDLKKWTNPLDFIEKWSATIDQMPNWLTGMFAELGIDLNKTEGEVRGRVQEVIDGYKKYVELEKRIARLEKELAGASGESAEFEARLKTSEQGRERLEKEVIDLRDSIIRRDVEISQLKEEVETLKKNLDPEVTVIIPKDEYESLTKRKVLDRFSTTEIIKELLNRALEAIKSSTTRVIEKVRIKEVNKSE